MPIIARDNRSEFQPAPEGLHQAVCVDVVDQGLVTGQYGTKHKIQLRWQLDCEDEEGRRPLVVKSYTLSLNEKAILRHHLEAWRGRPFTPEELEGFDLEKLIGANCQIQIVHNIGKNGGTWANVQAVVGLGKGMVKMQPQDYTRVCDRDDAQQGAQRHGEEDDVPFTVF